MKGEIRLDGAVALITGGGSGIGRATAQVLGQRGARVVVTELPGRKALADEIVAELNGLGAEAMAITLDVKATPTIPFVIEQVVRRFGSLDILVNNAGTQILKPALDLEEHEFDEVMNVNLKGAFMCAQAAGAVMADQKRGCIVNVASQHGVVGNSLRAPYCASKAGLINLTRALAIEWAEYGIRVNAISPTFVVNGQNQSMIESGDVAREIQQGVLLGRAATTEEVAWGIYYLASPMASMVTGHNLVIDGGWTAR
ncbi:SDR family NAD(P)-dependent oxidoreductase [Massilia sp. ST3]|uniref:SDR family NAD(P)-dependent oxidoreductase n=1 Tax=Massilia sp. ST3 TaxID=2824903 RepID=UPI001B83D04D|nr:SDR family oxidoreductase [Massilia sp. ST3]MBQ5949407.1 SDR family oxidoreductase [Massilia sp. ST3]